MKKMISIALFCLLGLTACEAEKPDAIHGYVEGEFIRISPTTAGLLESLNVTQGQQVAAGAALFKLDLTDLLASRDQAEANILRLSAELADLSKGERPEEIKVIEEQQAQAKARLINARQEYERILSLSKKGTASVSSRDNAKAELDTAKARMAELDAQLQTANLGARPDRLLAAEASLKSAKAALKQIEKKIAEATPLAPLAAKVEETYFRPGEFVAAGQPVVSLLAPENIKLRFFVSQEKTAGLTLGQEISVTCDGCAGPIAARISYIASEVEYTPPVIYSVESRQKLVFLVEAKAIEPNNSLRPGIPIDVSFGG